jgi:hydrogenase maturation factor
LAQAIRDCSSVNRHTQVQAIEFFISDDFKALCESLGLDTYTMRESMMSILATPRAMLKKVAEDTISSLRASLWQKKANS